MVRAALAVTVLLTAACQSLPPAAEVRRDLAEGRAVGRSIDGVPFVEQPPYGCGPAALAAVLGSYGIAATPAEIREAEIVPSSAGTYTYELALAARAKGLFARDIKMPCVDNPTPMRRLIALLDEGIPVIVLLRQGFPLFRTYHYVAVVGYDDTRGYVLYQDGYTPDGIDSYASFQDAWHDGDHWALVAFPSERDYAFLTADDHLELAAICEERGSWSAAERHYHAVLRELPGDGRALVGAAGALSHLDKPSEATALFEECLQSNPVDARALNNFALHLVRTGGDLERAEALVRKARQVAPEFGAFVDDTLGQVLEARGDRASARKAFEEALAQVKPDQRALRDRILEHLARLDVGTR